MNDEEERKRKLYLLIVVALLIAFLAFSLAQNAQNTADINNMFVPVVNNTNLAPDFSGIDPTVPFGTGERVQNVTYNATNYSLDLHVFAHAMSVSDTAAVKVYIDGVLVSPRSGRPLGAAETAYRGVDITIPKNSSYLVNISNYHHYEWREYPILAGKNGTLSLNQTFITTGNSFNATYDQTTKEYNANYTAQTFPNHSIYGLVDVLNSSKVNKTGDTITGDVFLNNAYLRITGTSLITRKDAADTSDWSFGNSVPGQPVTNDLWISNFESTRGTWLGYEFMNATNGNTTIAGNLTVNPSSGVSCIGLYSGGTAYRLTVVGGALNLAVGKCG